ncbi:two-component sensor histidine kinase [Saccharomonospora sp. CUA-673]|nr:two-component sensor histidine kinase [Saccharomonospora sp. CUA-673]
MTTDAAPRLTPSQQTWRILAAAALGLLAWWSNAALLLQVGPLPTWYAIGDPAVGVACLTAVLWRRRFPFTVAMITAVATVASTAAAGAALLALCSLATRRRPVEIAPAAVVLAGISQLYVEYGMGDPADGPLWLQLFAGALVTGIAAAVGAAIGARRVELRSLRQRAESAEREQHARAAQARTQERNRIAREMHDVLAHRISLVSMQAGVLDHRSDLGAEDSRVLVRSIADSSRRALEELREVLGVLRAEPDGPEPPQPSLEEVPNLVDEARSAGLDVILATDMPSVPSETVGRTCYRIVREGLTNAAKHAPGSRVSVTVERNDIGHLHVIVRNSPTPTPAPAPPVSGFGLLGLAERVQLAGGALDHRATADGGYVLTARLPSTGIDVEKGS